MKPKRLKLVSVYGPMACGGLPGCQRASAHLFHAPLWPQAIDRSPGQSVMPHIDTPQVKQHILADVGGVVGDSLKVADYEEQVDSRR